MNKQTQKRVVLKENMKKLIISLLPMVKKMVNKKNNQIKSGIMKKIVPNKLKKRRNTLKRVSKRGIKSLENNFSVKATKNIINTPKIIIEKPQTVVKPKVVTSSKIATKPKKVSEPKIVDKSEIVIEKSPNNAEYKKTVKKEIWY